MALPDQVRAEAARAITVLKPRIAGARWVPAENLHATVAFLGETERAGAIAAAVAGAAAPLPPISLRLEGVGAFPSQRRARVVWAGLGGEVAAMASAAASVGRALAALGFPPDARAFSPHVTLARLKTPAPIEPGDVQIGPVPFTAEGLGIYRSHLGRPAPRYERIAFAPFLG